MDFSFTEQDITRISEVLQSESKRFESAWSWNLSSEQNNLSLILNIYHGVKLGGERKGCIISAQTQQGYFELHDCCGYMIFEPDEVIFIQTNGDSISCLIIGKGCTCSLFSNIDKSILNADFTSLDAPVLLAAMQLSITEELFSE
jgi:hypothetical protein